MKDRSNKNGKVYKFRPKNKEFDYKNVVKKEFPKGNIGESEGDVDLLMIFGMDSEAKKKDPERYKKVKKELENKKKIKGEQEFVTPKQRDELIKKYSLELKGAKNRILPNLLILVICAILEIGVFYDHDLFARIALLYHSAIMPLVALQILVVLVAVNYKKYIHGFGILTGLPSSDSIFFVT